MERYQHAYRPHAQKAYALLTRKPIVALAFLLTTVFLITWYRTSDIQFYEIRSADRRTDFDGRWIYSRDRNNLLLDDAQCGVAFPRLFEEIDRAVDTRRENRIEVAELDAIQPKNGYVRAMIYDQEVHTHARARDPYTNELPSYT